MNGKRILVTGAASGIGAALVSRLTGAGAHVTGLDRHADADIVCDLGDPEQIAAAARIAAQGDPFDGIAHVAGLPGTADPRNILAVNLAGPVLLNHHLTDHLAKSASIVVVASITAQRCTMADAELVALVRGGFAAVPAAATGLDGVAAYQLSKKAILCWMGLAVRALHPSGTRINAVSPGPVETPILADFETSIGKDRIDASAALTGRHGQPEEIAAVIAWLLGLDASWINGVDIRADGGYHVLRTAVALAEAKWS